jgi:nucleoside-diphosphate-sugar epimerase
LRGLSENAELTPTGPYGPGKAAAEQSALSSSVDEVYVVRLPFVFGVGDRTGRTEALRRLAMTDYEIDVDAIELGLVPANVVAERLVRLAERRCPGRRILNVDGGRNWTLREHLAAARRAFPGHLRKPTKADLPFNVARDFSLDSGAVHQLLELDIDDDLGRQWGDVARAW